jgi:cholesterol oxidase
VEPKGTGYTVTFDRIADGALVRGDVSADRVVLAAGSLGSTELLLRCRDQYKTLPAVSVALGRRWSANANVFTTAVYGAETDVQQSIGPTITTGVDFMDGSAGGERFYIEDDGFPNMLLGALTDGLRSGRVNPLAWALQTHLRRGLDEKNPARNMMVWLGEGRDAGDGQLRMARAPFAPWRKELRLHWDVRRSRHVIEEIIATQKRLSESTGGRFRVPLSWRLLRQLATVHPLGGCTTGTSSADAVVDHRGEVFGHPNLFVADGSVLPGATGRNPSMTIAAVAERTAALML